MQWRRLVPVALMGALGIAYVLARPALAASIPYLAILEFPVGALVLGILLWLALARRTPRPEPQPEWRRHEQVVRALPDPATRAYMEPVEAWLETGERAEEAAVVLAKAATTEPAAQERLRAQLLPQLTLKASRRKRESLLKQYLGA